MATSHIHARSPLPSRANARAKHLDVTPEHLHKFDDQYGRKLGAIPPAVRTDILRSAIEALPKTDANTKRAIARRLGFSESFLRRILAGEAIFPMDRYCRLPVAVRASIEASFFAPTATSSTHAPGGNVNDSESTDKIAQVPETSAQLQESER